MDDTAWNSVDALVAWLDTGNGNQLPPETRTILQILKITEEAGEVAQAVIGATGQNPRKGYSHSWEDVQDELCDVIISAMTALRRINPDARTVFNNKLAKVSARAFGDPPAPYPPAPYPPAPRPPAPQA